MTGFWAVVGWAAIVGWVVFILGAGVALLVARAAEMRDRHRPKEEEAS